MWQLHSIGRGHSSSAICKQRLSNDYQPYKINSDFTDNNAMQQEETNAISFNHIYITMSKVLTFGN